MTVGTWLDGAVPGLRYRLLRPAGFDASAGKTYPLLVFLHMLGRGNDPVDLTRETNAWFNPGQVRDRFPNFTLVPMLDQSSDRSGNSINYGGVTAAVHNGRDWVISAIQQVCNTQPIDKARVLLTGASLGGLGSWELVCFRPDLFAAVMPLAGANYWRNPQQMAAALKNKPIWAIHGAADHNVSPTWDRAFAAATKAIGGIAKYSEDAARGHDVWDYWYPRADIWEWLFAQRLDGAVVEPPPLFPPPTATPIDTSKPVSANGTILKIGLGGSIIDNGHNTWTITDGGQVAFNGSPDATTKNVVILAWIDGTIWQRAADGSWYYTQTPGNWRRGIEQPPQPPTSQQTSPDDTVVKAGDGGQIVDAAHNVWTITDTRQVALNGVIDRSTSNVTTLAWHKGTLLQCNTLGNWYAKIAVGWDFATDPFAPPPPTPSPTPTFTPGPPGTGFRVKDGQIIAPDGSVFIARGVNVYLESIDEVAANLDRLFPGTNAIRLVFRYAWDTSAKTVNFIKQITARNIVVMLDDHVVGNSKPVPTGATLTQEMAWFRTHATTFRDNPYVWYQSQNEPTNGNNLPSLSQHDRSTYDAVRNAGNPHMITLTPPCGGNKGIVGAQGKGYDGSTLNLSVYADMTNVVFDMHWYPFMSGYSTDPSVIRAALMGSVAAGFGILATQSVHTAEGVPPVIIAEFGDSTVGSTIDKGGSQNVAAVLNSGYGFSAFTWCMSNSATGDVLTTRANPPQLTTYGRQVAARIAELAAT